MNVLYATLVLLCLPMFLAVPLHAAGEALPDEMILSVGTVENVGTNVTVVLKKRSVRSDTYALVLKTSGGFKQIDSFPVRTYRGYVKEDPLMQVNASIETDGTLSSNFSEGRDRVGQMVRKQVGVLSGKGTPLASAGNKVVPLSSLRPRPAASPGDNLPPRYPMRRVRFTLNIQRGCLANVADDMARAVAEAEQRFNAADFVYARDIGVAWELNTLVVEVGGIDLGQYPPLRDMAMDVPDRAYEKIATFWTGANVCNRSLSKQRKGHDDESE